ncbi:MAG: hypothetical protein NW237_02530, partial [Cyanobacteriota bacterium]|nr:hypothetical protein [Cyanobacteriota bacterium]
MTSSANLQWWLFWRGIRVFLETLLIKGFGDQSCWFNLPRLDQMMGFAILIPGCQARQGFKMMALRSSFGAIEDWN